MQIEWEQVYLEPACKTRVVPETMIEELAWIPTIMLLAWCPLACYHDIVDREMPKDFWLPVIAICGPVVTGLYLTGFYPWYLTLISAGFILLYLLLAMRGLYQGGDFWFLALISLFFVQNPLTGHILMPISFAIFFLASFVGFAILSHTPQVKRWLESHKVKGFPTMLTITLAFVLTVVIA